MPVHDWTRVDAGIFHAFHTLWIAHINDALNEGMLPADYYALPEQHAGDSIADILTLHAKMPDAPNAPKPAAGGGVTALAEAPPRVRRRRTYDSAQRQQPRTISIRHVSGHRLVAMLEIVSPGNKDRQRNMDAFIKKAVGALDRKVNLLLIDLFPPGPNDPQGIPGEMARRLLSEADELPPHEPLTFSAFLAGSPVESFVEYSRVGQAIPPMPLFLLDDEYINLPLEQTYQTAFRGMPAFYRELLAE